MSEALRERVASICGEFPAVEAATATGQHWSFSVRGKKFAYFLVDHHADGKVALNCRAPAGVQEMLVSLDARRFFVPAYVGARGWVGVDLEAPETDWDEVALLLRDAYVMTAPKRLAAEIQGA